MPRTSLWASSWVGAQLVKGAVGPVAEAAPTSHCASREGLLPRPPSPTPQAPLLGPAHSQRDTFVSVPTVGLEEPPNDSLTIRLLP